MRSMGTTGAARLGAVFATSALLAPSGVSLCGLANADTPKFDIQGYTTCTATTIPGPDEGFDGMVTSCCVQNAGVPTPSSYGMACAAMPPEVQPVDYRPTIVLPTRPAPVDDGGLLGGPNDDDNGAFPGQGLGDPDSIGNPFDQGGPR